MYIQASCQICAGGYFRLISHGFDSLLLCFRATAAAAELGAEDSAAAEGD